MLELQRLGSRFCWSRGVSIRASGRFSFFEFVSSGSRGAQGDYELWEQLGGLGVPCKI